MKQDTPESRPIMLFYESFEEAINDVFKTDKAIAADLYSAVIRYGLYGEEPPKLTGLAATLWKLMFPTLKKGREKAEAGRRGGKVSKHNNPNGRRGKATVPDPESSDSSQIEIHDSRTPRIKDAPTFDNIRDYVEANNLNVDAEEFYNYYSSQNWKIDGNPIRSVTALLKRWSERANGRSSEKKTVRFIPNECGDVNVCGIVVKLGYGERVNNNGQRTYGNGKIIVPPDAPRRPADSYDWSETLNEWVYNSF